MVKSPRLFPICLLALTLLSALALPGESRAADDHGYFEEAPTSVVSHQRIHLGKDRPQLSLTVVAAETAEEAYSLLRQTVARDGDPAQIFKNTEVLGFVGEERGLQVLERLLPASIPAENRSVFLWPESSKVGAKKPGQLDRRIASLTSDPSEIPSTRKELLENYSSFAGRLSQGELLDFETVGRVAVKTHFEKSANRYLLIFANALTYSGATIASALISTDVHWGLVLESASYGFIAGTVTQTLANQIRDFSMYDQGVKLRNAFLKVFGYTPKEAAQPKLSSKAAYFGKFLSVDIALNVSSRANTAAAYEFMFQDAKPLVDGVATIPHDYHLLPTLLDGTILGAETAATQGPLNNVFANEYRLRNLPYAVQIGYYSELLKSETDPLKIQRYRKIIDQCLAHGNRELMTISLFEKIGTFNWIAALMLEPVSPVASRIPTVMNLVLAGGFNQYYKSRRALEEQVKTAGSRESDAHSRVSMKIDHCRKFMSQAVDRVKTLIRPLTGKKP